MESKIVQVLTRYSHELKTTHLLKRKFNLKLYLLIVFGLSWPFQIITVLGPNTISWRCIFNSLSMIMVGVGTFICAKFVFRDGLACVGWRWGGRKYWLAAIGIPVLLWIVPFIIDLLFGNIQLPNKVTMSQMAWSFEFFFIGLIPAFGEEIGWRGYMLPHMARIMSPRKAIIWHGVIWYVWHLPLVAPTAFTILQSHGSGVLAILSMTALGLVLGGVLVVFDSAIFAKLWAGSGSIAIVTVLHGFGNGFRDTLTVMLGDSSGAFGAIFTPVIAVLIGMYLLWKTNSTTFQSKPCFE